MHDYWKNHKLDYSEITEKKNKTKQNKKKETWKHREEGKVDDLNAKWTKKIKMKSQRGADDQLHPMISVQFSRSVMSNSL